MLGIAIGHSPSQLGDINSKEATERLIAVASYAIDTFGITKAVSAILPGWDSYWAIASIRKKIPLTVVTPFMGPDHLWKIGSQKIYQRILSRASEVIELSDVVPGFNNGMDLTNDAIVQLLHQQVVDIAAFEGGVAVTMCGMTDESETKSRILYASNMGIKTRNMWSIYDAMRKNSSPAAATS